MIEVSPGIDQRTLKVSDYSKEGKVDELIGEGALDVTETLRKGESDGEYTASNSGTEADTSLQTGSSCSSTAAIAEKSTWR